MTAPAFGHSMLAGAAMPPGVASAASLAPPLPPGPDADLIALCAAHPALIAAFNAGDGDGSDNDPTWVAYRGSCDAIHAARPQTLAGMRAKALAAKAEARTPEGSEAPDNCPAETWSWDLVNDLLRLTGGAA
jgi:hypothetical protein